MMDASASAGFVPALANHRLRTHVARKRRPKCSCTRDSDTLSNAQAKLPPDQSVSAPSLSRRVLLSAAVGAVVAGLSTPQADAFTLYGNSSGNSPDESSQTKDEKKWWQWLRRDSQPERNNKPEGYSVYKVANTEDVTLVPRSLQEGLEDVSAPEVRALFMGEHHWSFVDHTLQAKIIENLWQRLATDRSSSRKIAIGLEMIQQRFQYVLDAYIARHIDEMDLYVLSEWETRWVWPFEQYLPVFRMARRLRIPLIALSADAEDIRGRTQASSTTQSNRDGENTYGNPLPPSIQLALRRLVSSDDEGFQAYVNASILPSYAAHARAGLLSSTPSFEAFYKNRIFRDETMAARAESYLHNNPDALLVCLMGIDHVKFAEYGVPGRVARLSAIRNEEALREATGTGGAMMPDGEAQELPVETTVRTVLLNPTSTDAFSTVNSSFMLDLPVRGRSAVPISDYLWFSSQAATSSPIGGTSKRSRTGRRSRELPSIEELVFQ